MKKFTKLFSTLLLLCVSLAGNAETKVTLGTEYTSVADLNGKAFAIINKTDGKAICNKNNGNDYDLQYLPYADAFTDDSFGWKFKIQKVNDAENEEGNGKYLIRCVKEDGSDYTLWGWAAPYFQSNTPEKESHCCFFFFLGDSGSGADAKNTAVWDIQYVANKGFTLKNIGTGKYYNDPTKDANSDEPAYFTFCDVTVEEILAPGTATVIKSVDYSSPLDEYGQPKVDGEGNPVYPYWFTDGWKSAGSSLGINNGALDLVNDGNNFMLYILDWFNVQNGYDYKAHIVYKSTAAGSVNLTFGTWDDNLSKNNVAVEQSDSWQEMVVNFGTSTFDVTNGSAHVLLSFAFAGTLTIKEVEVIEITPATPPAPKYWYTILEDNCSSATNFCVKYFKNYVAATAASGAIVTQSLDADPDVEYPQYYSGSADPAKVANDWDTQFFIKLPVALPNGTKVRFSMRCKADKVAKGQAQSHGLPVVGKIEGQDDYSGTYAASGLTDDVNFQTNWATFYKEFKAKTGNGMDMQSICFNLEVLKEVNNYYFDDIIVAAEITEELAGTIANAKKGIVMPLTVTSAGYSTFVPAMDVTLPETIKAYTAKLSDSKTSVALTPITEIPAGTPVIIEATQGDYSLEVITSATAVGDNSLLVSDGTVSGDGTIYVLAEKNGKVGFYRLASGVNLPVGKAYLKIVTVESREFIAIDGEATGIKTIETAKANGAIYNLAGQQVKKAQKGIYIINGKKAIVK